MIDLERDEAESKPEYRNSSDSWLWQRISDSVVD